MNKTAMSALALALLFAMAAAARADDATSVRLIGTAPSGDDPVPKTFVLDLSVTKGDSAFQSTVTGWFAALPPDMSSDEVSGSCVRSECAVQVSVDGGKLSFSGDFTGARASSGRFSLTDDDGKAKAEGVTDFKPITGAVGDLGLLAPPDAVTATELRELLLWSDVNQGFNNADDVAPGDSERDGLASWQQSNSKPMTGLIFAADLAALRANAEAARKAAGWTKIEGDKQAWSAAYPAALLPKASGSGSERRFASADGKAVLVVGFDAPMSDDDFSALVDKLTAGGPGRSDQTYTRVNGDMTISYVENGMAVSAAYHDRASGLARLVFSRPKADDKTYELFDALVPDSLKVADDTPAP
jgi:hypothetical protein